MGWLGKRSGVTAVPLRAEPNPHDDDRADLHQVPPRLRHAPLGRAGHLPRSRLAAELPEKLGDLHQAGGGDRIADAEQSSRRAARQVAVARRDAVARGLRRLPFVEEQQPFEVVQLLVVERVVRLGDVDLLARLRDAGHVVRHPRGVLDVLRIGEVAVRPVRRVEVPADAVDPHRLVRQTARGVLARHHDGDGAVADRRDVEALDGPRQDLARQDVVDRDVGLAEQRGGVVGRVPLVLHRHGRDVAFVQAVALHVPVHLEREDPQQVRPERTFDDVVEDREERALRVRLAGRHLLLADDERDVGHAGRDGVPPLDRREHAGAAARRTCGCTACRPLRTRRPGSRPCGGRRRTRRAPCRCRRHRRRRARARTTASAAFAACQESSLPVSCARRTKRVMPAPITATRRPVMRAPRTRTARARCRRDRGTRRSGVRDRRRRPRAPRPRPVRRAAAWRRRDR